MEIAVKIAVDKADGHCNCQGVAVFQGYGAFQSFDVIGEGDMII